MLIASHSGQFQEDGTNNGTKYWVGDKNCGWDACTLSITNTVSRDRSEPIQLEKSFVGIPCPMDLGAGDTINLCGIAIINTGDNATFGAEFGFFRCGDFSGGEFPQTNLVFDNTSFQFNDQHVCWNISYTLGQDENIYACSDYFTVGMNTVVGVSTAIKFSYTFMITRQCT
jgi:hypothetical protein